MKNEFKAGDLVFVVDTSNSVRLGEFIEPYGSKASLIEDFRTGESYFGFGYAATTENRQALITLYSEDEVPELPLRGSKLTKKLLEKQKYVLCLVSHTSDDKARSNNPPKVRTVAGVDRDWFESVTGLMNEYAVPIDNNGNEITEIE